MGIPSAPKHLSHESPVPQTDVTQSAVPTWPLGSQISMMPASLCPDEAPGCTIHSSHTTRTLHTGFTKPHQLYTEGHFKGFVREILTPQDFGLGCRLQNQTP